MTDTTKGPPVILDLGPLSETEVFLLGALTELAEHELKRRGDEGADLLPALATLRRKLLGAFHRRP